MNQQERLRALSDIETCLAIIRKHNKRPYRYRLIDCGEIHGALNLAQPLLKLLLDAEQAMETRTEIHYSGECVECGRNCTALSPAGVCEGCVMQAAMES